jgi:TRAP-type uncharacterized transport system fused permease subunit
LPVTAYIVLAIFGAPAMIRMGVPLELAHYFVLFPACFAHITPPVAFAAVVAAKIAGANYMKSAMVAVKAGCAGFLLPYMFIFTPALLLQPQPAVSAALGIIACIAALFAIQFFGVGYFLTTATGLKGGMVMRNSSLSCVLAD